MKLSSFSILFVFSLLLGLNILAWKEVINKDQVKVTFFSIGQGDGALIQTGQGHEIVIDGGPDNTMVEKLGKELAPWDTTIDLVILSHPAADHVTGLLKVLDEYHVQNVLWSGIEKDTETYRAWENALEKEKSDGANIFFAKASQKITWGQESTCDYEGEVLSPAEDISGSFVKDDNNTSVVVKFTFCNDSVLFTGDIEKAMERDVLSKGINVDSDILKVSHHGGKSSSSPEFVQAVSPSTAVISVGKDNSYGHPSPEVLEILGQYGIEIKRTDEQGDIRFTIGTN